DEKTVRKDRVMQWLPPYGKDDAKVVYATPQRITRLQYSDDCKMLFLTQTIENQQQITAVDLSDPKTTYVIHRGPAPGGSAQPADAPKPPPKGDEPSEDADEEQVRGPGLGAGAAVGTGLLTRASGGAVNVVRISSAGEVYVSGTDRAKGDAKLLPRPYLDKVHIKTGEKTRIFEGKGELLETIDTVDGDEVQRVFTTCQKQDVVPNSYVTDLKS